MDSRISTPSASHTRARPWSSFAGWIRAPYGPQLPPRVPATPILAADSAAPSRTCPSWPYACSSSTKAFSRASCGRLRATSSTPPFTTSASMPSSAATRITSSTEAFIACCMPTAAGRPYRRAKTPRPAKPL